MEPFVEQDRHRKALALIICLFLSMLYFETIWRPYFEGPRYHPQQQGNQGQAGSEQGEAQLPGSSQSTTNPTQAPVATSQPVAPPEAASGYPSDEELKAGGILRLRTKQLVAEVSLLGGRITSLKLNEYYKEKPGGSERLDLVASIEQAPKPLGIYSGSLHDARTQYQLTQGPQFKGRGVLKEHSVTNEAVSLTLDGMLPDGRSIRKKFRFYPSGYLFDIEASISQEASGSPRAAVEWTEYVPTDESSMLDPYNVQGFTWFDGEAAIRTAFSELEKEEDTLGKVQWVSLANKYFAAVLLSRGDMRQGEVGKHDKVFDAKLSGDAKSVSATVFAGPKSYERLEEIGFELQRNIDFGWTGFVAAPLLTLLHWIHSLVGNYGLAIVVLTILVRLALYPLNVTQFKQMKTMQDLKPEIDRIRERVDDKQEQQRQLMELYTKKGANPLGGCLPLVLQMPIFIGLYSALMLAVELRGAHFALWINDLSAPEELMIAGMGVPVMVILFVVSMMVQQMTSPTAMDPTQKKVMLVMPVVFGFMFANFPAGLTLYWLTSNLISIGQQKALHRKDSGKDALKITLAAAGAVFVLAFIVSRF